MEADGTRKCVAEFIGTFGIVFFGCGSVVVTGGGLGLVGIALTFGLIVGTMVASLGHISGAHINPAVTFMALVTGRMKPRMATAYVTSQILGGIVAASILKGVVDADNWQLVSGGSTTLSVGVFAGFMIEILLTFFLVLVIFGSAIDPRGSKLGPALLSGTWEHHWVYWAGPLLGSVAAAFVYEKVLMRPNSTGGAE